ncbi:transmembrane protein 107 isoform X3 [Erinaceus europaeus]|uniref:Transmembrane protein 107 n=1 Tax=Erinaceus europaeus TaxID=9365 RepID=A0ABM3YH00_ERIEU|nr:transmembrane protein 107 isoform X3 [Erinaceus europaeus]
MSQISRLVPSRFLTLLAHLVVVITLFWSRPAVFHLSAPGSAPQDSNIQACLPLTFTPEEYAKQDTQLVAALSVTLGLFAVELTGFFSGVSMFNSTQSLISLDSMEEMPNPENIKKSYEMSRYCPSPHFGLWSLIWGAG